MPVSRLLIAAAIFFLTSSVSVVTGSTSLITVPVLITFGIEPHVATATNMMALIFMSAGGSLPFAQKGVVEHRILPFTVTLTVVGSTLGAFLLLSTPTKALQLTIAIAMVTVATFSVARTGRGESQQVVSSMGRLGGYLATFLLAIYRGVF